MFNLLIGVYVKSKATLLFRSSIWSILAAGLLLISVGLFQVAAICFSTSLLQWTILSSPISIGLAAGVGAVSCWIGMLIVGRKIFGRRLVTADSEGRGTTSRIALGLGSLFALVATLVLGLVSSVSLTGMLAAVGLATVGTGVPNMEIILPFLMTAPLHLGTLICGDATFRYVGELVA